MSLQESADENETVRLLQQISRLTSRSKDRRSYALIRRTLKARMSALDAANENSDWRSMVHKVAGMWSDRDDLDAFYSDMRLRTHERFAYLYNDE
jgi:hypothetical protein